MTEKMSLSIYKYIGYAEGMPELPRDTKIPDLVSTAEAAAMLGITRQAIVLRAAAGHLLGAKVGSTWVFRRALVEKESGSAPTA